MVLAHLGWRGQVVSRMIGGPTPCPAKEQPSIDAALARQVRSPLTTVRQPTGEVAALAIRSFLEILEGRAPARLHQALVTRLALRASTGSSCI